MAFHWKDGWYFERLANGSVRIYHEEKYVDPDSGVREYDVCLDIDSDSWASILASVSARGETGETFREAVEFGRATLKASKEAGWKSPEEVEQLVREIEEWLEIDGDGKLENIKKNWGIG